MTTLDTTSRPADRRRGRHPINIGHFVMGIAFLGIVVVWILIEADAVTGEDIRWLLPVPWVLAGVAGLLATTRRRRDTDEWRDAAYAASGTGWIGDEPARVEETRPVRPVYDDLDEKLAHAERDSVVRQAHTPPAPPVSADPADPLDPADPADPAEPADRAEPADPADPPDPADPADPSDSKEKDR